MAATQTEHGSSSRQGATRCGPRTLMICCFVPVGGAAAWARVPCAAVASSLSVGFGWRCGCGEGGAPAAAACFAGLSVRRFLVAFCLVRCFLPGGVAWPGVAAVAAAATGDALSSGRLRFAPARCAGGAWTPHARKHSTVRATYGGERGATWRQEERLARTFVVAGAGPHAAGRLLGR